MPLCSAFSKTLIVPTPDTALPPSPVADKNWMPGNWIGPQSGSTKEWYGANGVYKRLEADTAGRWKGAMLRFQWDELERAEGEYEWEDVNGKPQGFALIEQVLKEISGLQGRRLIVFFQVKTFNSADNSVPAYMRNSATYADTTDPDWNALGTYRYSGSGHGQYAYVPPAGSPNPNGGYVPNIHITAVRERFKALMAAFATKFNNSIYGPYIEAIAFSEASINKPMGSPDTWTPATTWYNNMTNAFTAMRTSLPDIQICQWINSPRDKMEWWVPDLIAAGIGLGMPDMSKDTKGFCYNPTVTPGQPPGNIYWMNQSPNSAIRMGHASKPTLESTVMDDDQTVLNASPGTGAYPGVSWTRQDIATWSKEEAAVTHRVWAHNTGSHTVNTVYNGQNYNTVTKNWIENGASDISVNETRPTGW